ncbi:MAG: diguanylate cyclase domain-containing protein [Nocardioidaceae bacterium]
MDEQRLSEVLADFARTLTTNFPIQKILDHLVDCVTDILPVTGTGVLLMENEWQHHFVAASNDLIRRIESLQIDLHEGPCLQAYLTGEATAVRDLHKDTTFPRFSPKAIAVGMGAVYSFPLRCAETRLGALELYAAEPIELSRAELSVAQTLADVAAAYLFNAQAREDAEARLAILEEETLHDRLTGLPNQALIRDRLDQAMTRSLRSQKVAAVLFLDVDKFKTVNDTYGHIVGDSVLQQLVQRVQHVLRNADTFARLHGDEFVVICEGLDAPARAEEVARRVISSLDEPLVAAGAIVPVRLSIGIAFFGPAHATPDEALHQADVAMYTAKRNGGHRHVIAAAAEPLMGPRESDGFDAHRDTRLMPPRVPGGL